VASPAFSPLIANWLLIVYPKYITIGGIMARTVEKVSKLARWGNSLGLRIPREGVSRLGLTAGVPVRVRVTGDSITIRRAGTRRKWTEAELLKGVNPAMCGPDLVPDRAGGELI
jgi:antitoxin MazE